MKLPPRTLRLFKPSLGSEEIRNISEVFERAWLGLGPTVTAFEKEWTNYIGASHSIALNSCTAALHLALAVNRFPAGSKVLVPAITFVATAHAAIYNNLTPVLVDVDAATLTIDLTDLERKITKDCVAVIPVHLGGQPVPMEKLLPIARAHNLLVIEDCANSGGGSYLGRKLGTWGDVGCFSFEEKKNMTTGDGGMICVGSSSIAEALRAWRWLGIDRDTWKRAQLGESDNIAQAKHWYYEVAVPGYKYNMNDIAAAIGIAQLKRLDAMNARRAQLIARYLHNMKDCSSIRPTFPYSLENSAYWLFSIRVKATIRDKFVLHLKDHGIATGLHFMPLHYHPLYKNINNSFPNAESAYEELVTLPLHPDLSDEDVDYVCEHALAFARSQ